MSDKVFIDTNILIYLYSDNERTKKQIAQKLVEENTIFISTQVVQEFANILRKKYKVDWKLIRSAIEEISRASSVFINHTGTINQALVIADKYQFSFYDSLIVASALENNCNILYSEDMQHKQVINGKLHIINPFK